LNKIILTLILLLMASPAFCAEQFHKTICLNGQNTGGTNCDYTALETAVNANEGTLTGWADFEILGNWATADTTAVTIHNYVTTGANYINIYTSGNARHNGREASVSGRQNYSLATTTTTAITLSSAYVTIDGLEISCSGQAYQLRYGIYQTIEAFSIIKNNIIRDISTVTDGRGHGMSMFRSFTAFNNLIYNVAWRGIEDPAGYATATNIFNNTIYNFNAANAGYAGIVISANTAALIKNNIVVSGSNGGVCYTPSGSQVYVTNGGSDTTGDIDNLTAANLFVSVTAGSEDLRLKAGAAGIDVGTDLGASYNTDIIGTSRPQGSAWDIGAFEYIASTPTSFGSVLNDSVWNDTVFK
jgi:DNA-binding beta-propeller fold protein YncE